MGNIVSRCFGMNMVESFKKSTNNPPELPGFTKSTNNPPELPGLTLTDYISIAQNRKNNPSIPIFPPEVTVEIMAHMPVKSLIRHQLVSKQWQSTVYDNYFREKIMNRIPVLYSWYYYTGTPKCPESDTPFQVSYIHGLDGLFLTKNENKDKCFIWNPATRRSLEWPYPYHYYAVTLSYIPATKNYRLVSVHKDKETNRDGCEVFTPGHSQTWRRLTFPNNVNPNWRKIDRRVTVISSGVAVHCILTVKFENTTFDEIVSLDIETERFTINYAPNGNFQDWTKVWALDWDGKLAFADINGENLEVMELEDYKMQRWCKNKKIIHLKFMKKNGYGTGKLVPLIAKAGDIWFWLEGEQIFSYTIETGCSKTLASTQTEKFDFKTKLYPYKPSLVDIEGMQPEDPGLRIYRPRMLD